MHWSERKRLSQYWYYLILSARPAVFTALPHAKVVFTRHSKGTLDRDNLYGSAKIVIDALRYAGVIVDDSPEHLILDCQQERRAKKGLTVTAEPISAIIAGGD
jgi:hypothetical protein